LPPLLTTWGDKGPGLVAVAYNHAIYLFVFYFVHVVIMSVHDSMPVAYLFGGALRAVGDILLLDVVFGFHGLCLRPC